MRNMLLLIAVAAMAGTYGYSVRPDNIVTQIELQPERNKYIPVCGRLPLHVKPHQISVAELMKPGR